jgi:hypothetical protein
MMARTAALAFHFLDQLDGGREGARSGHVVLARLALTEEYVQAWNSVSGADFAPVISLLGVERFSWRAVVHSGQRDQVQRAAFDPQMMAQRKAQPRRRMSSAGPARPCYEHAPSQRVRLPATFCTGDAQLGRNAEQHRFVSLEPR